MSSRASVLAAILLFTVLAVVDGNPAQAECGPSTRGIAPASGIVERRIPSINEGRSVVTRASTFRIGTGGGNEGASKVATLPAGMLKRKKLWNRFPPT